MGIARRSSDRMRTIWTPEMDRYFIDLMLEQIGEGNRVDDRLFSKRAWKHMAALFNAKFNFQHEKEVLKNRHKTLRNLYRAIKSLVDQHGFSWDETRQMVTADNELWDDYIKVHPDARSYRIKTIPYYSDLCKIYSNATVEAKGRLSIQNPIDEGIASTQSPTSNGQQSDNFEDSPDSYGNIPIANAQPISVCKASVESLHEIMIDEDYRIAVSEKTANNSPRHASDMDSALRHRSRTSWQPPMDRYFVYLLLDQVQKGIQIDGQFRKQAWTEMIESFNARFGFNYDIDILKNRYKTLRRQHNVIKNLLELDRFEWDDKRQMVTADDCVWQDYIKEHTDARQYMTRPTPYYKDLCVICKELNVDGKDSVLDPNLDQHNKVPEIKFGVMLKDSHSPTTSASSKGHPGDENESSSHMTAIAKMSMVGQKQKRLIEDPSTLQAKKFKGKDEGMAGPFREMVSVVSSLADNRKEEHSNSIPVEVVVDAIQALPDMDEELILDACDLLEDEKKAKTFLALDVKIRKKWLIRKLRPQSQ